MTTITILPEKADSYRALAGGKESTGRTAGEALDALAAQLEDDEKGTLVIVQNRKADEFFTAEQQERLTELMKLREAGNLSAEEERELESLIEAELVAARERATVLTDATTYAEIKLYTLSDEVINVKLSKGINIKKKEIRTFLSEDSILKNLRAMIIHRVNQLSLNPASPADSIVDEETD